MHGGAALRELFRLMASTSATARGSTALEPHGTALTAAANDVAATTALIMETIGGNPELALANATLYLDALGHVVVAWRWLEQALAAEAALPSARGDDRDYLVGKLAACRFFFRHELPRTGPPLSLLRTLDDTAIAIPDAGF